MYTHAALIDRNSTSPHLIYIILDTIPLTDAYGQEMGSKRKIFITNYAAGGSWNPTVTRNSTLLGQRPSSDANGHSYATRMKNLNFGSGKRQLDKQVKWFDWGK